MCEWCTTHSFMMLSALIFRLQILPKSSYHNLLYNKQRYRSNDDQSEGGLS